jgi:hypothetical protein
LTHFCKDGIGLAPAATWSEVERGLFFLAVSICSAMKNLTIKVMYFGSKYATQVLLEESLRK